MGEALLKTLSGLVDALNAAVVSSNRRTIETPLASEEDELTSNST